MFQRFRTGSQADTNGYIVASIELELRNTDDNPAPRIQIWRANSNNDPWYWHYELNALVGITPDTNKDYHFLPSSRKPLSAAEEWGIRLRKTNTADDSDYNVQRVDSLEESGITDDWNIRA